MRLFTKNTELYKMKVNNLKSKIKDLKDNKEPKMKTKHNKQNHSFI